MKWISGSIFLAVALSAAAVSFVGCSKPESSLASNPATSPEPKAVAMSHVGSWRCPPGGGTQGSEWGPIRFRLKLTADGRVESRAEIIDSPGGDGTIEDKGTYVLEGERFTSEVFGRGEPAKLVVAGEQLILTMHNGETYRYERTED